MYRVSGPPVAPRPFPPATTRRRAVTLTEAVLFIAVALGLIVGGIVFYRQATLASAITRQVRVLSTLSTEMLALGSSVSAYQVMDSTTPDNLFAVAGLVPPEFVSQVPGPVYQSYLRSVFDGELLVTVKADKGFLILAFAFDSAPVAACARMILTDGSGHSVHGPPLVEVYVSDVDATSPGPAILPPLSPAMASQSCKNADVDNDGQVGVSVASFLVW